ncbi:hypothetical protein WA026_018309 [Henosepilachna vigintioctopunctata]|uniref:Lipase domain-containing protein n=1 Tax=Henosepilachna vigintioctopunctata TaxID=420089 RepID=A0AAW1V8S1_9CUCU
MAFRLVILLSLLLSQCREFISASNPEETFMRLTLTNINVIDRTILMHELPSFMKDVDGYVYILMHDFDKEIISDWYVPLSEALIVREPRSAVLQFFWRYKRRSPWPTNTDDIEVAAKDMVVILTSITDSFPEWKVIIIGHGKGALIGGVAGRFYNKVHQKLLGRLIALDPEEISINLIDKMKVSKEDAHFVMVIHTVKPHKESESEGHIEFFPNGGEYQPGCGLFNRCKNRRSFEYFTAAVICPEKYMAKQCLSYKAFDRNSCAYNYKESLGSLHTMKSGFYFLNIEWLD